MFVFFDLDLVGIQNLRIASLLRKKSWSILKSFKEDFFVLNLPLSTPVKFKRKAESKMAVAWGSAPSLGNLNTLPCLKFLVVSPTRTTAESFDILVFLQLLSCLEEFF